MQTGSSWLVATLCLAEPILRTFVQYLMAFCSRSEPASDTISFISSKFFRPIVLDKCVKFRDPCLNCSWEVFLYDFRPEIDNDIKYSVAVDYVGMDCREKNSRSNGSRDIRGADFMSNERIWVKPIT